MSTLATWFVGALAARLRGNANLAAWVGTDTNGKVKVYHHIAPPLSVLGSTERYVVFHTNIGGTATTWDCDDLRIDEPVVQFDVVDKSGSSAQCAAGIDLVCSVFEPISTATIDTAGGAYDTLRIAQESPIRGPYKDDLGRWVANVDYRFTLEG